MSKVAVSNPDLVSKTSSEARTYLSSDYASGLNLAVRSSQGFTVNDFAIVGEPTQEQTQTKRITGVSDAAVIVIATSLDYSYAKSTPVYQCQFDKVSFECKPSGGSFAEISGSPFDIDWDNANNETLITYSSGASTDTYRWRFFNSNTGAYSDYSDELAGGGLTKVKAGFLIQEVKKNPVASNVEDETILRYFEDFQELVYEEIPKAWWFSKEGTPLATVVSTYKYAISSNWSDFLAQKFCLYRYISGSTDVTYPLTWSPPVEFYNLKSDANQDEDDSVKYWSLLPPDSSSAKGYIGLHPTPKTDDCYIKPVYFFELSPLDSFGDTIVVPKPKGYIDYALYRIFDDIKSDQTNADKYNARVKGAILSLKRRAKRQLGQPEFARWRGTRGWSRLFGEQSHVSSSELTENFW